MLTTTEEHVDIEQINQDIIHVTLHQGAHLTTQLLRELEAGSKAAHGKPAAGYIFTIDPWASDELCCQVCKKTQRLAGSAVAIVCTQPCVLKSIATSEPGKPNVFKDFSDASKWITGQLPALN